MRKGIILSVCIAFAGCMKGSHKKADHRQGPEAVDEGIPSGVPLPIPQEEDEAAGAAGETPDPLSHAHEEGPQGPAAAESSGTVTTPATSAASDSGTVPASGTAPDNVTPPASSTGDSSVTPVSGPGEIPPTTPVDAETPVVQKPAVLFGKLFTDVIKGRCVRCHQGEAAAEGVDLSSADVILRTRAIFGDENETTELPLVVPGKPDESLLWKVIESGRMPLGRALTDEQKALFKDWIETGAQP